MMTRWLDRMDKRHPIAVKAALIVIAFVCLYISNEIDRGNDTALRLQILSASQKGSA